MPLGAMPSEATWSGVMASRSLSPHSIQGPSGFPAGAMPSDAMMMCASSNNSAGYAQGHTVEGQQIIAQQQSEQQGQPQHEYSNQQQQEEQPGYQQAPLTQQQQQQQGEWFQQHQIEQTLETSATFPHGGDQGSKSLPELRYTEQQQQEWSQEQQQQQHQQQQQETPISGAQQQHGLEEAWSDDSGNCSIASQLCVVAVALLFGESKCSTHQKRELVYVSNTPFRFWSVIAFVAGDVAMSSQQHALLGHGAIG
ncbi:unnamed protein product [Closterium sp. NIES-53]